MADDSKIVVSIELDDGSVRQGFARVQAQGESTFQRIGEAALGYLSAQTLIAGFETLKNAIEDTFASAIKSAAEADQNVRKLNTALAIAGRYSGEASATFQALADKIQATTAVSDDTVLGLEALATTYTKTNEQAIKLTKTSVNLAAVTGNDVNTSLQQLAATLSGQPGRFARLFPELKKFTEDQLKAGAAIDYFNTRFANAAEAQVNSYSGRVSQLANAFDDVLKELGRYVTQSPTVITAIRFISDEFSRLASFLSSNRKGDFFAGILQSAVSIGQVINDYIVRPIETVTQIIGGFVSALVTGFKVINTVINLIGDTVISTFSSITNFFKGVYALLSGNTKLADELRAKADKDGLFSIDFSQTQKSFDGLIKSASDTYEKLNTFGNKTPLSDGIGADLENLKNRLAKAGGETSAAVQNVVQTVVPKLIDLSKVFQEAVVKSIVAGVSTIGANLAKGKFSFQDFLKAVLGVIGDLAIQVGTTLIGIGLAIDSLKVSLASLNGATAIAAGIALVALGGALKSISGGGTQGATSGAVATSGGGGFVPTDPTTTDDVAKTEKQLPTVTVNIQGDVLDSRDTGMRIIDIINDTFNSSGARILAT